MSAYEQSIAAIDTLIATTAARAQAADAKLAEAIAAATAAAAIANTIADAAAAKVAETARADAREFATHAASANCAAKIAANHHGFLQKYHDDYDCNVNSNSWSFTWNKYEQYFEALNAYTAFLQQKGCKVEREEPMQDYVKVFVTKQ